MPKAIVFCADGTWNGPEDATGASVLDDSDTHGEIANSEVTNVVKLYAQLAIDAARYEIATIYYGQDVTLADAQSLAARIRDTYTNLQTEIVNGGQPHMYYIVSVE